MEYDIEKFIEDYINRTQHNSKIINAVKKGDYQKVSASNNSLLENQIPVEPHDNVYEVTHLLNSFFGVLIVPFESFNSRVVEVSGDPDEQNEQLSSEETLRCYEILSSLKKSSNYKPIEQIINRLKATKRYRHNYNARKDPSPLDSDEVFMFLKRLRNSLSHSGREGLSFLPIRDIEQVGNRSSQLTHVLFHDELIRTSDNKAKKIAESYIKLEISELFELYHLIAGLFKDINQKLAFTPKQYKIRVDKAKAFLENGTRTS